MDFSEVIGQEAVKERLIQMVKEDRLPHALLFCGPHGAGKMALAMAFACYLLAGDETKGESSPSVSNRDLLHHESMDESDGGYHTAGYHHGC